MARKRNIETEAKIAAAATALFCEQGYVDTTMAAIAAAAGVSVQTLYLRHGSKAAILSAALDAAITGDVEDDPLLERPGTPLARALAESDARRAIALTVRGAHQVCERTHLLYRVIRSASADLEVAAVREKNRSDRAEGLLTLAKAIAKMRGYKRSVPAQRTADLLYALATEDGYLLFIADLGWKSDVWQRWVIETISTQVLLAESLSPYRPRSRRGARD